MDHQPFSFYMCTGRNPFDNPTPRTKGYGIFESFSALLNIVLYIKIFIYKRKSRILPKGFRGALNVFDLEKQSLVTITSNSIGILIVGISAIVVTKMNATKLEDLDKHSFHVLTFYRSLIAPIMWIIFVVISCLLNKSYIRAVAHEFLTLKLFASK